MPWERKGLNLIFGKSEKDLIPTPVWKPVDMPSIRSQPDEDLPVPVKRAVRGAYQEIINFDCKLSEQEVEESQHRKALEIWYIIFSSGKEA